MEQQRYREMFYSGYNNGNNQINESLKKQPY